MPSIIPIPEFKIGPSPVVSRIPIAAPVISPGVVPELLPIPEIIQPIAPVPKPSPSIGPSFAPSTSPIPVVEPVVGPKPVVQPIVSPVPVPEMTPIISPVLARYAGPYPGLLLPVPFLPTKESKTKRKIIRPVGKGYEVEIRRRRKFEAAAPYAFATKEEAISFGARKTLGEAAATFRVVPSEKPLRDIIAPVPLGRIF